MKKSILVVDDEEDIRELLIEILQRDGFEVLASPNKDESLSIIRKQSFDLILTDMRMPGGSGIDLLMAIRAENLSNAKVVVMTGFSDLSTEEMIRRGATSVLAKPFRKKQLLDLIHSILDD